MSKISLHVGPGFNQMKFEGSKSNTFLLQMSLNVKLSTVMRVTYFYAFGCPQSEFPTPPLSQEFK